MFNRGSEIVKNNTWFLRSGIAPRNTPEKYKPELEDLNHMTSKKFAMTMVALSIIAFMYFASIAFLFFMSGEPHVSALVSMYKDMIVAVAAIAATLVGVQGLVDWRYTASSTAQNITQTLIEKITNNAKEDDYKTTIEEYD